MSAQERNICPADFQDRLTFIGGVNRYDEPMFKLVWSQYETYTAGGVWSVDEKYYMGYRQLLAGSGEPCWTLMGWHAPEEYGTPERWYVDNYDESTGLQILGEYPYFGRYEVMYNLRWNSMEDDKLTFHTMPLNNFLLDTVMPIILAAKDISYEKRKAAYEKMRAREEAEKLGEIERHLRDKAVPFGGNGISFSRQGIRSTIVDQKMIEMQRMWNQLAKAARELPIGSSTK
jgi:hypothetical protein